MCGIVGYVGYQNAAEIILDGLSRLEYRGYDSAGVAVLTEGDHRISTRRDVGKLINLQEKVRHNPLYGKTGIGHTRWATHGVPSEANAHPHVSMNEQFVVVHNGIVENYLDLRQWLHAQGISFQSDTDTEVIVQLVQYFAQNEDLDLVASARRAVGCLRGAHAIVLMSRQQPEQIIAIRIGNAGGVVIGLGEGENYIASDIPAILTYTRQMIFLEDRQMAVVSADYYEIFDQAGQPVTPAIQSISYDPISAVKGEYRHFMQKEIFEQPRSITDTIRGRVNFEDHTIILPELNLTQNTAQTLDRLVTVACGTSYYSGLIGKFYFEHLARLTVDVEYASEYRYRDPILTPQTAVLAITQSGETVDTLAAMEEARHKQATVWSIVNALGSQAMRVADGHVAMHAGPEIGVASTKAFTTSIVDQLLMAVYLGQLRGTLDPAQRQAIIQDIARLPDMMGRVLTQDETLRMLAEEVKDYRNFLYLGRGINYPIALEGALKLKEISYIHAEGYPAGEMKHGPIALVDEQMPIVAIALKDALYEKMISQIEQAKARRAFVIALATEGDTFIAGKADRVIYLPDMPSLISPLISVLPLQLLAYHIADVRGTDVDQPRNLAKSVTVE